MNSGGIEFVLITGRCNNLKNADRDEGFPMSFENTPLVKNGIRKEVHKHLAITEFEVEV